MLHGYFTFYFDRLGDKITVLPGSWIHPLSVDFFERKDG